MTPTTPPKKTLKDWLSSDQLKLQIAAALPKHITPDRQLRVIMTAMNRTPKLWECEHSSLLQALIRCSEFGLEPDGRRAHLIPFRNNKKSIVECQLIIDYKGLVELAYRSGTISNVHADVVCENDTFEYDKGVIVAHKIDFRKPRGKIYAAYAIARMKDGGEVATVLSQEEIESTRKRSKSANDGPWQTDWSEMAKKTAFRRLSKWLTLSPEFRDAVEMEDEDNEQSRFAAAKPVFDAVPQTLPEPTIPEPLPAPQATPEFATSSPEPVGQEVAK